MSYSEQQYGKSQYGEEQKITASTTIATATALQGEIVNLLPRIPRGYGGQNYGGSQYGVPQRIELISLPTAAEATPGEAELINLNPVLTSLPTTAEATPLPATPIGIVDATPTNAVATPGIGELLELLGRLGDIQLIIDGTEITAYQELVVEKRLNQVDTFEFKVFITDDSQRGLLTTGKDVQMFEDGELFFKGRMEDVSYETSFEVTVEGEGMETRLLDRKTDRETFDNTAADQVAENIIDRTPLTKGVIEEAPLTSLAFDHDNLARALAGAANTVGYDWRIRQDLEDEYEVDYIDFVDRIGSESPVFDFVVGETALLVDDETEDSFLANDITLLGRGDGINQLEARLWAAAKDFTQLTSELEEENTDSFNVTDTKILGETGDSVRVKVGVEMIEAEIMDDTTLNIVSRGVNSYEGEETSVITHRQGISVWLEENMTQGLGPFTPESQETAEEGSSINVNGVKQLRETDKTLVNLSTLEQVGDRELRNRFEDIKMIEVQPANPRIENRIELGDNVRVEDGLGSSLNDVFRVVGKDITRRTSGEGSVYHLANRPKRLVERLGKIERDRDTLNAHMQGATNIDSQSFRDNCDFDNPLKTRIYIPDDVVAVNKVELVFAREPFRGYVQNTEHSHSITIDPHTHELKNLFDARISFNDSVPTSETTAFDGEGHLHSWPESSFVNTQIPANFWIAEANDPVSEEGGGTTTTSSTAGAPEYGIFEPNSEDPVDIEVLVNGEVVETIEGFSVGQEASSGVQLGEFLEEPIAGRWHDVEVRPSDLTRLNANIFKKVYIESTL